MKRKILSSLLLTGLVGVMVGCLEPQESDLQKSIERDDTLLKTYLTTNSITATETPLGYYYKKEISNDIGNQIVNKDTIGVYYEIKTTDGQLIDSYLDESLPPRLYHHQEAGLVPRAMNFASGLAKEGETFTLYIPSYLAYQGYSFQQLILPNSNLVIKVKYAKVFESEEVKQFEGQLIESYIQKKGLTGFQKTNDGLYVKVLKAGVEGNKVSKSGDVVRFLYKLSQLDSQEAIAETTAGTPFQITVGNTNNLKFINSGLKDISKDMELEIILPSHLGFGGNVQVFPYQIRKDLFEKSMINQIARPFEPLLFKVTIVEVK